jgi:hypothetical protein
LTGTIAEAKRGHLRARIRATFSIDLPPKYAVSTIVAQRETSPVSGLRCSAPDPSVTTSVRRCGPPVLFNEMSSGKRTSWNEVMKYLYE